MILIVRILEACNAGCFMCASANSGDEYRFGLADARELRDNLRVPEDFQSIRFTGGEPLLHDELAEIVRYFELEGLRTSVITNGWHLAEMTPDLQAAGLRHVIVSLDGAGGTSHDRFRRQPGLFERVVEGIRRFQGGSCGSLVRVNTVAGPHNASELCDLYKLLAELGVAQWSIIPLKRSDGPVVSKDCEEFVRQYARFRSCVAGSLRPKLLGYSAEWAGRSEAEVEELLSGVRSMAPRAVCKLVDEVRYYVPKEGFVYPCNCIPHRRRGRELGASVDSRSLGPGGMGEIREWLSRNGPEVCTGCEPINAALGEGLIDIEDDLWGF